MSWVLPTPPPRRREGDRLRKDPALLSAVLDATEVPILVQDGRGRVVLFSRACEALSGYRSDEMRGRAPWDILLPPEAGAALKEAFDPLRPSLLPARQELPWKTRDGRIRRIAWWHSILPDVEGIPRYVVSAGMDLTELRALETRAAEISERERERFGQDLHDGLGQDLTAVALSAGLLKARLEGVAPELGHQASTIEALARKAIAKTRALAKGIYPAGLVSDSLPDYLKEVAQFAEETFGVKVELDWDARVAVRDESAARNLYWIVQESVTNAVKHGGSKRIRIRGRREGKGARISVRDDGKGLGASPKTDGLGLRVMTSRARSLGAELRIRDHPEGGVLVECVLPDPRGGS
jgi:two-component system CheB/CheR fusion protein